MRKLLLFSVTAVLSFVVTSALALPTTDSFGISFEGNKYYDGWGSGFNDGTGAFGDLWYYYEDTDWFNQSFYDAPPDPDRYKESTYDISIYTTNPTIVKIALNWITLAYPETGPGAPPPSPPLTPEQENDWIVREVIFEESITTVGSLYIDGTFIIPDYNSE